MKVFFYLITLILIINPVFSEYNYYLNEFQKQSTVNHGDQAEISYMVKSQNSFCSMSCEAKIESSLYSTDNIYFDLSPGGSARLDYKVHAPTKKDSNYLESGSLTYDLDITCNTIDSGLFCNYKEEDGSKSESTSYKLIYELSNTDKNNKEQLDKVLDSLINNVNDVNNKIKEVDSLYNNAKSTIKISNLNSKISSIENDLYSYLSSIENIESSYNKLDFSSAINKYNSISHFSKSSFESKINEIKNEISEVKEKHDSLVTELNLLVTNLNILNEDAYLFKLDEEYDTLINDLSKIQSQIKLLSFNSYFSLEKEIISIDSEISSFKNEISLKKKSILNELLGSIDEEFSKLGEFSNFNILGSAKSSIENYCNIFENELPNKFNNYNLNGIKNTNLQNQIRIERNLEIDTYSSRWVELENIIKDINNLSSNKFDEELSLGCSIELSKLVNSSLGIDNIDEKISICSEFREELKRNVEENRGLFSSIKFFFKNLFQEEITLEEHKLPELNSFKDENEIFFSEISFSKESIDLNSKYCDINIETKTLSDLDKSNSLKSKTFNDNLIDSFEINEGECANNNCYSNEEGFPILFVHGHLFDSDDDPMEKSIDTFTKLVNYISEERENTFDAGKIVSAGSNYLGSSMSQSRDTSLFRTTYYGEAYINSEGKFVWVDSKYESISYYADKLKEIIDSTLKLTDREKIKIVSHSMGGLVTREYIRKYGSDKIEVFIMIGTPNKGVEDEISSMCTGIVLSWGNGAEIECGEMSKGSAFLNRLNDMSREELPEKTYIIAGQKSENNPSDGIVELKNTGTKGLGSRVFTKNGVGCGFSGTCLHSQLIDPSINPEIADLVIDYLE